MTQTKFVLNAATGKYVRAKPKVKHVNLALRGRVKSQILRMKGH